MTLLQSNLKRASWRDFWPRFRRRWNRGRDGEHVFIYGETGSGKTDLMLRLANSEPYSVVMITKPRDPIFRRRSLITGWSRLHKWNPSTTDNHILLSAPIAKSMAEERANQVALFPNALDSVYADGGWSVFFDEGMHMSRSLGMDRQVSDLFYLGRSQGISAVLCSQRPRYIPVIVPQSSEHAFISRSRRGDDIRVLSELGPDAKEMRKYMSQLTNKHDFIYLDTQGNIDPVIINTHR